MRLRDSTRKIIAQLEEKSGYPVQVLEEADLPTIATIRIARPGVPAHILKINSLSLHKCALARQCSLALRLFEREQKFQTASSPKSFQFIEKKNHTRQTAWYLHLTMPELFS